MRQTIFLIVALVGLASCATLNVHQSQTEGLVAATFTAFDSDGNINTDAVQQQAKWLNDTNVKWVFVSGTTGESVKLTFEERKSQAELWVKTAKDFDIKVIIHVGTESTREAIELAKHAEAIGAHSIGAMPPVFFKPANIQALAETMSAIFNAAPSLPAYYYHIPSMTGVDFAMYDLVVEMEKVATPAPNFAGVKYTGLYTYPGFMDVAKILNYKNRTYDVLCGRDEMMIEALTAGIRGFVGSQYNIIGDLYNQIIKTFDGGDLDTARKLQLDSISMIDTWLDVPVGVDGVKNVQGVIPNGINLGNGRLPNLPCDAACMSHLQQNVKIWCNRNVNTKATKLCVGL